MSIVRRWIRRSRTLVGSMSLRSRIGIALMALAVMAGLIILLCRENPAAQRASLDEIDPADISVALEILQTNGIAAQVEGKKVAVARDDLGKARTVLAYEGLTCQNPAAVFEQLAREGDIWTTSDQSDKRWQAAKMSTLGRLISMFPPVRSAMVMYEPGSPQRLGKGSAEPTASVKVILKRDATMDRKLVIAIADLVSGSISGMNRQNVHIVDNGGRSYHVNEAGQPDSADQLEQLRLAEELVRQRILQALAYVKSPTVAVRFETQGAEPRCVGVSIALPESYVRAVGVRATTQPATTPIGEVEAELDQIARTAMMLAGLQDRSAVIVNFYRTQTAGPEIAVAPQAVHATAESLLPAISCAGLVAAGAVCGLLAYLRRRRRRAAIADERATDEIAADELTAGAGTGRETFKFLETVGPTQLLECLRNEHPQTIALVLAQIDPDKSAGVFSALSPAQQVEVSRRIVALDRIDPEVSAQLAATLRDRLGDAVGAAASASGMSIMTRILHQANPAIEQSVLSALAMEEPTLADSIRRRLLAFEDIAHLPSYRLRAALEQFDSEELAVAMRTASRGLKSKLLESLSSQAAQRLREEMERMGPVRLSDVESAQQHVAEAVRRSESGTYVSADAVKERLA